jgi:hypothetical protein
MDDMARIDLGMAILGFPLFVLPLMQIIHWFCFGSLHSGGAR